MDTNEEIEAAPCLTVVDEHIDATKRQPLWLREGGSGYSTEAS